MYYHRKVSPLTPSKNDVAWGVGPYIRWYQQKRESRFIDFIFLRKIFGLTFPQMETKLNSKHFFFKTRIPTFCCKIHISKFSIQTFCPNYLLTCYRYEEWRKKRWRWWQCWPLQIESGKSVMVMCSCHLVIPEFHKFTLDNGTILWD